MDLFLKLHACGCQAHTSRRQPELFPGTSSSLVFGASELRSENAEIDLTQSVEKLETAVPNVTAPLHPRQAQGMAQDAHRVT